MENGKAVYGYKERRVGSMLIELVKAIVFVPLIFVVCAIAVIVTAIISVEELIKEAPYFIEDAWKTWMGDHNA